ncbi:hypothetical protein ACP275_01G094400 [Erythranthe tilingii]
MEGEAKTIVLVGRTGNGKSATCNSILGKKIFKSMFCAGGVTGNSEKESTHLEDGQILHVIDTPGLFDFTGDTAFLANEIAKCIDLANNGLHAIVLVLSIKTRFSREEEATVDFLRVFFGPRIVDYMIVVFTGGDELEESEQTLDSYLGDRTCPEPLKETLKMCGNRRVLFDNKTKDQAEQFQQRNQLLFLVNEIVAKNGGKPYTDDLFVGMKGVNQLREGYSKEEVQQLREELHKSYQEQLKRITDLIESKVKATIDVLAKQLEEAQDARIKAEAKSEASNQKANEEINKLTRELGKAQIETEWLRKPNKRNSICAIL